MNKERSVDLSTFLVYVKYLASIKKLRKKCFWACNYPHPMELFIVKVNLRCISTVSDC